MDSFTAALRAIGRRIKELRRIRRWNQEKLAGEAGLSRTYLGTIELGAKQATVWTLFKIAKALDVPLAELFLPASTDEPQGKEIVARIHALLVKKGRTLAEIRKIAALVEAYLRSDSEMEKEK